MTASNYGLYDFSARYLHTSLGRFTTIDPLAEKYPSISPYTYCNGNPVRYVDPDGMFFNDANEKRALRMEKKLDRKVKSLSKEAERKEKRNEDSGDLHERIKELNKSIQDIKDMRDDANTEYLYKYADHAEIYGDNIDSQNVVFIYFEDFETQVHESRHGGQHARGEANMLTKNRYGVADEVDAYRAQYAWLGTYGCYKSVDGKLSPVTITNIKMIDTDFVNTMSNGLALLYPPAGMSLKDWNKN